MDTNKQNGCKTLIGDILAATQNLQQEDPLSYSLLQETPLQPSKGGSMPTAGEYRYYLESLLLQLNSLSHQTENTARVRKTGSALY